MIKKIIFNSLLVASVVWVMDFSLGNTMRYYYFKETSGLHYRTTYSMDKTRAEIVVLGSSRANHHYVPEIFEEKFNMSFYNTGRDGNRLLYNYAVFTAIQKRYFPKIVILDIGFDELYHDVEEFARLSSLLPYYKDHPEIRNIVEKRSPFERIKLFSSIYPFNSAMLAIAMGNLEINKKRKSDRKGYVPLEKMYRETSINEIVIKESPIDSFKFKLLKNIAEICHSNKIKLVLTHSPIYAKVNNTLSTEVSKKLAKEYDAIFIDMSRDLMFLNNPAYFQDESHLNVRGATEFSKRIANQIASSYQK